MSSQYEVIIADDADHEKVFAEIYRDNQFLALISQEDGPEKLKVEFPGPLLDEAQVVRCAPLTEFMAVLEQAARKLVSGDNMSATET